MEASRAATLAASTAASPRSLRPVLTSLNGDNSWLISFPRPLADRINGGKAYWHVVFEPWLTGPTSMLSSWFVHISLSQQAAIPDPAAIAKIIRQVEGAAAPLSPSSLRKSGGPFEAQRDHFSRDDVLSKDPIDAILLGFHYLDHVHEATLRQFDTRIPVIATPEAARIVSGWHHFDSIILIPDLHASATSCLQGSPQSAVTGSLPPWLTVMRLAGHHELNYCLALVWSHESADGGETVHEAILQSPHGTRLDEGPLQAFLDSPPRTQKLALLHGLKESHTAGRQTTLGAQGGLALWRRIGGARYWVLSHHADLRYAGIFMRLSRTADTERTLQWALEEEEKRQRKATKRPASRHEDTSEACGSSARPNVVQVANGGCLVLV